jgi:endonuclease G, mitochondrial
MSLADGGGVDDRGYQTRSCFNDQKTATHISAWLQIVVTPGRDTELYRAIRSTVSSQTFGMKALAERLKKLEQLRRFNASIRQGDTRLAEESNDLSSLERLEAGRPPEAVEQDFGLESIALRRQRSVLAIKDNEAQLDFLDKADSEIWAVRLKQAKPFLDSAIRAVGRVELQGGMLDWVGTGWLVADDVMVTSRKVANLFAARNGQGFSFRMGHDGPIQASVDFLQEIDNPNTMVFQLVRALHIEDEPGPDIAFFEIAVVAGNLKPAAPIELATEIAVTENVAVIGYPAYDSRVPGGHLR